ncbi:MAG: hypothetical protein JWO25_2498 [Alphaproteobacteria bacterium]|nr:hypothetical protein [Alphaproteobacteria bacterium]MDB5722317.1 hypothetical protein [Alphaproteobacteria bacterium]
MQYVVFRRGGEPGKIAINPAQVTEVRSSPGPYTDIHFGAHRIAVEGTFDQVVSRLSGRNMSNAEATEPVAVEGWLARQVGHR